jgi:DNA modification methylase
MTWTLLQGDALQQLRTLPDQSVHCCVTSPPYWNLRNYGVEGQLGLEPTPDEYVAKMVEVFQEVKRVLRKDGTLWLNIGDCYASKPPGCDGVSNSSGLHGAQGETKYRETLTKSVGTKRNTVVGNLKPKDLVGIPWRLAFALQEDGWWLRSDIIWAKPNPMPESVTDRPTKAHEYIFLLSKSERYYYNTEAIREPMAKSSEKRGPVDFGGEKGRHYSPPSTDPNYRNGHEQWGRTYDYRVSNADGNRNKRTVWTIATKPFSEAHFATFPPALIVPCILAGCPEGGTVLDPFVGSGTVLEVSEKLGRNSIGIELNPDYCDMVRRRMARVETNLFTESGGSP